MKTVREKSVCRKLKIHGLYKHFKGKLYLVEDVAFDSETEEKVVVNRAMYGEKKLWVRPLEVFFCPRLITKSTQM